MKIHILSDATGETAERLVRAALMQFEVDDVEVIRHHNLRSPRELKKVLTILAAGEVAASTFVSEEMRQAVHDLAESKGIVHIDLLGPILDHLAHHLSLPSRSIPGIQHRMEAGYRQRIEAIEYSVKHDDGLGMSTLRNAEIVITGVSRTGKTPLSIYLANRGCRVGNVPLVVDIPVPSELLEIDKQKVIGLYINPDKLAEIREARLRKMGSRIRTGYTDSDEIKREVQWIRSLYSRQGWRSIDVTSKAVEEIATEIEEMVRR